MNTEHNIIEQFEHLRLQDPILFGWDYESSGHGDECWEYCHPDTRNSDSMDCNHCPSSDEPDRWREFADLGIEHVQCSTDLATLPYDLSNLIKVGLYIYQDIYANRYASRYINFCLAHGLIR